MEIRVSVRQLVEFILRSGSIDNRRTVRAETAMQEGGRIHRMLQKKMGADYHAEVTLRYLCKRNDYDIVVEGRADGVIDCLWHEREHNKNINKNTNKNVSNKKILNDKESKKADTDLAVFSKDGEDVVIDEIKGTYRELRHLQEPVEVHLAQAKCYAFIYMDKYGLKSIGVRMTYCHMETEEIKYFHYSYTEAELSEWFWNMMKEYGKWADFQFEWIKIRTESIKQLAFPFEYRAGQKELVRYVYQTIYHGRKLFIEAPTGVGKTISTIFPSVKAMGENMTDRIFYLTAKTITATVATECFAMLAENGLLLKTISLTARDKICFLKNLSIQDETEGGQRAECNPDACPYADGHYDRINDAMYELLTSENAFTREKIMEYAQKHRVCPFELSLDMSMFSDVVIGDYNYLFDPRVSLKRFFADNYSDNCSDKKGVGNYIFLIDEAHNLLERGREMYSAVLYKEDFLKAKKYLSAISPQSARLMEKCNRQLLELKRECVDHRVLEGIDSLVHSLNRAYSKLNEFLTDTEPGRRPFEGRDEVLALFFEMAHFLNMYEIMDERYIIYSMLASDNSFFVKLFCADPSGNLRQCMQKGRSSILFSATFLPIQYYKKLLGGDDEDYEVYAETVFDEKKRALVIATDVTSMYKRRNESEYGRIAEYIYNISKLRRGNYMVFFPSYNFLEQVYDIFMERYFDSGIMECALQLQHMSEDSREEFLRKFTDGSATGAEEIDDKTGQDKAPEDKSLIGFCVMGGIFSEGIDLKRDSLIGAIIVGTGIPQVGAERELLKNYFDKRGESGFDYAYRIPGMNKVLQSAGRVIRTAEDVGVVALLDERFLEPCYRRMFPREWSNFSIVRAETAEGEIGKFWDEWGEFLYKNIKGL